MTYVVDPFGSTTVYATPPFVLEDGPSDANLMAFRFHDRNGVEYDLTFCRPETCEERSEPGVVHSLLVANVPGWGPIPFPPVVEPERFGPPPADEAEARVWGQKFLDDFKSYLAEVGRPVDGEEAQPLAG